MVIIEGLEQGTTEWLHARAARITASRAAEFSSQPSLAPLPDVKITKEGKVNYCLFDGVTYEHTSKVELQKMIRESLPRVYPDMRNGYLHELIGQVCTGEIKEQIPLKQADWGHENEDIARSIFEFETGKEVRQVGFIYKDEDQRAGISPDGLVIGEDSGLEIKCPWDTKWHIDFILAEKIKPEYIEQCQFSMWVTGYKRWYFASYDPRMKSKRLHYVTIERDEEFMKKYDEAYTVFISEMDKKLASIGFNFSDIYTK
tara:strand:+ start:1265 stop:2038 length:774 start_codon:yes stop_codon:yes gene_type:complete